MADAPKYGIVDKTTGKQVGTAMTFSGAMSARDRRDNAYGAYVHRIVPLTEDAVGYRGPTGN